MLYYAAGCGVCSEFAEKLKGLRPIGITFVPAELHPTRNLTRITYELLEESISDEGVAAIARLLEHVNFAWALFGSFLRLPVIGGILQLIIDSTGGEEREVCRIQF